MAHQQSLPLLVISLALALQAAVFDQFSVPLKEVDITYATPPGISYKHHRTNQMVDYLYVTVQYPLDWTADDKRPVFVHGYGSGWNGIGYPWCQSQGIKAGTYLAGQGAVYVSFQYRDGYEKGMADASSAIRWTRQHAAQLGIDPNRVIGAGNSSGGHITLSATVFDNGPINPWDDPSIPDACQYHYGINAVVSRPDNPEISPAHHLRDNLPPYWLTFGTADSAWLKYGLEFVDSAKGYTFPFEFWLVDGETHGYTVEHIQQAYRRIADFLYAYGGLDYTVRCEQGDRIPLDTMQSFFRDMGLTGGVTYEVDKGGTMDGSEFVDDGVMGASIVTARSKKNSQVYRQAYILVGAKVWAEDESAVTIEGDWKRIVKERDSDDSTFHNVYYTTTKIGPEHRVTFKKDLPAGDFAIFAFKPRDPWFTLAGTEVIVKNGSASRTFSLNMKAQPRGYYFIGTVDANGTDPVEVTITANGNVIASGTTGNTIIANGLAFFPRYTGGTAGLAYPQQNGAVDIDMAQYMKVRTASRETQAPRHGMLFTINGRVMLLPGFHSRGVNGSGARVNIGSSDHTSPGARLVICR